MVNSQKLATFWYFLPTPYAAVFTDFVSCQSYRNISGSLEICVHSDLCMSLHSIVVVTVHSSPGELACLCCSSCVYVEMCIHKGRCTIWDECM